MLAYVGGEAPVAVGIGRAVDVAGDGRDDHRDAFERQAVGTGHAAADDVDRLGKYGAGGTARAQDYHKNHACRTTKKHGGVDRGA